MRQRFSHMPTRQPPRNQAPDDTRRQHQEDQGARSYVRALAGASATRARPTSAALNGSGRRKTASRSADEQQR